MVIFGDRRLDSRYHVMLQSMQDRCSVILRQLAINRNEEISYGRFLKNPKVSVPKILSPVYERTSKACGHHRVLLVQDTSTLGFGLQPKAGSLGPIGDNRSRGFFVHPTICLDADNGSCLGLSALQMYQRIEYEQHDPLSKFKARKSKRRKTPYKNKESYRWWHSVEQSLDRTKQATQHIVVADSEADIYDLLVRLEKAPTDFVIRSYQDRTLNKGRSGYNLSHHLEEQSFKASYQVKLPPTDRRSAHTALLQIRYCPVNIVRPHDIADKTLPKVLTTNVIEVIESFQSVVGKEKPVHWRLLTSCPIESKEQVLQIIQWYTWRWVIEQLFRTIKLKGLNIQSAQVETPEALNNLTAMSFVAAVQIMQLVQARDGNNDLQMSMVFNQIEQHLIEKLNPSLEGNTQKLKNPHPPDSLAFASWVIARLGGWSGYSSQRPPGPITMCNGFKRFKEAVFFNDIFT